MQADVIDYELIGDDMQMVKITLDPGEAVLAEAGSMCYMTQGIDMDTRMDPHGEGGFLGSLFKAGKRMLTGESFFFTTFTCVSNRREDVAFASPYPGKIVPFNLREQGGSVLCQKDAFLCAARGVDVDIAFTKRLGTGFFGGEGFILQRLTGDGLAFIHAGGTILPIDLAPGERLRVDTGCLVGFTPEVDYDIQFVGGIKTALFGGEGLFFATMTGPGKVWLQTLPFSRLADRVIACAPRVGGRRKGEGSILGGLGAMLDGDKA
ncbi:MAG: TIGR00266 family protein [Phycisphaerales bacterium]|nr:MAG: TIGR00266 family protein [Phycisphaerales bacterium]